MDTTGNTNKDIRQYLHLHLGCDVVMTAMNRNYKNGKTYKLTYQLLHDYCKQEGSEIFKIALRPLSDMTEEEKKEAGKINDIENGIDVINPDGREQYFRITPERVQYLLSKHFDLFNLIPEFAIDATTLKAKESKI